MNNRDRLEYFRAYRQRNKAAISEKARNRREAWTPEQRDRYREYQREYQRSYSASEKGREARRRYYLKNRGRILEKSKQWRAEHPEVVKKSRKRREKETGVTNWSRLSPEQKEKSKAKNKAWCVMNRDRRREIAKLSARRRRAISYGLDEAAYFVSTINNVNKLTELINT